MIAPSYAAMNRQLAVMMRQLQGGVMDADEPQQWITANGAHVRLDENGEPVGKVGEKIKESGSDGPTLTQYRHDAQGAIEALKKAGGGVAVAALHHPEIGDIDLRWGKTSDDPRAKGEGLAKLVAWHPEVMGDLQGFVSGLHVHQRHKREIHLRDGKGGRAAVRVAWDGKSGHWLLTAYIRDASASKGSPAAMDACVRADPATPNNAGGSTIGFDTWKDNLNENPDVLLDGRRKAQVLTQNSAGRPAPSKKVRELAEEKSGGAGLGGSAMDALNLSVSESGEKSTLSWCRAALEGMARQSRAA